MDQNLPVLLLFPHFVALSKDIGFPPVGLLRPREIGVSSFESDRTQSSFKGAAIMRFFSSSLLLAGLLWITGESFSANQSVIATPPLAEIPRIANDGQNRAGKMAIAATANLGSDASTVITLESPQDWCVGRYFLPNVPRCLNDFDSLEMTVRTEWKLNCSQRMVQEKSRLVSAQTHVVWGSWSKDTQRPHRVYAYACRKAAQ